MCCVVFGIKKGQISKDTYPFKLNNKYFPNPYKCYLSGFRIFPKSLFA
jgi:hypothetical protein